jgi:hypothetical protein
MSLSEGYDHAVAGPAAAPITVASWVRGFDRLLGVPAARWVANRYSMAFLRAAAWLALPLSRKGRLSVVIVNCNTLEFLRVTLSALQRLSPVPLEVIVVDNGSTDGSRAVLRSTAYVRRICLRGNVGHAVAMDLGFLMAQSETVLSLDVDAFPIAASWLATVVAPLSAGYTLSGVQLWRPYAHPCCLAIRKSRFVCRRHTFRSRYPADRRELGKSGWDVGESISMREASDGGAVNLVPLTSQRGPGDVGTVFGDCVYHNFYSARHSVEDREEVDGVSAADAKLAWHEAVERYLVGPV